MTPEQEAWRALHGGTSRDGLTPAVRTEYDRLLAEVLSGDLGDEERSDEGDE